MAIFVGVQGDDWQNWQNHQDQVFQGLLSSISNWEERKRKKALQEGMVLSQTPGWESSPEADRYLERYGDQPDVIGPFTAARAQAQLLSTFLETAKADQKAAHDARTGARQAQVASEILGNMAIPSFGGGGSPSIASGSVTAAQGMAQSASEMDPTGLRDAFSSTPANKQAALLTMLKGYGVGMNDVLPLNPEETLRKKLPPDIYALMSPDVPQEAKDLILGRGGMIAQTGNMAEAAAAAKVRAGYAEDLAKTRGEITGQVQGMLIGLRDRYGDQNSGLNLDETRKTAGQTDPAKIQNRFFKEFYGSIPKPEIKPDAMDFSGTKTAAAQKAAIGAAKDFAGAVAQKLANIEFKRPGILSASDAAKKYQSYLKGGLSPEEAQKRLLSTLDQVLAPSGN